MAADDGSEKVLVQIRELLLVMAADQRTRAQAAADPGLIAGLLDFSLHKFVTRRVTAVFYTLLTISSLVAAPFMAAFGYRLLRGSCSTTACDGLAPTWAWLAWPVAALWFFVMVISLRLAAESAAALVSIAQNTERGR